MDTMKLLLGTIIALLLAALLMSWTGMKSAVRDAPADELARIKAEIASMKEQQERQALERRYIKTGATVAPPVQNDVAIDDMKKQMDEQAKKLADLEKEKTDLERDRKLKDQEQLYAEGRDMEKDHKASREARLISQALLIGKVREYVADEYGGVITLDILMPEQVQQDTVLAIRRKTGILGQIKITQVEGTQAAAATMPGFGQVQPLAGDELILPPRF